MVLVGTITLSTFSDQFVDAGSRKKIHFTQTITSTQDPGIDHENHQLAMILSPNQGTIYDGSLTYTSSDPVKIVVLHEINPNDAKGQPTWSVDGEKIYGLSMLDLNRNANSFEFTGAAVGLHSPNPKEFTATVSLDGWIRGQPTEVILNTIELKKEEPSLNISRAAIPVDIPLHKGYYNKQPLFFIISDSNNEEYVEKISEKQNWKVELSPTLQEINQDSLQKIYVFTNGIQGDGIHGFQEEVFSNTPSQFDYSPLNTVTEVTWKKGQNMVLLESVDDINEANQQGRIKLNETNIVLNGPQIVWPDGQMQIINDVSSDKGQIIDVNTDQMTVTFVAHRNWGPYGKTIYCVVSDSTPITSANMMGTPHSSQLSSINSNFTGSFFHFKNGIKGSGPLGYQPGIVSSSTSDDNYIPIWRTYLIEWNDPTSAKVLQSLSDIEYSKTNNEITVSLAYSMNSEHIVNCPIIDPFQ